MPYIYNSSASVSAATSENLQPQVAPAINRYFYPRGIDVSGSTITGTAGRHQLTKHIQFIPFKMASAVSIDRIGIFVVDNNSCVDTWTYDFALYTHNSTDNYPATKIADLGTITYQGGVTPTGAQLLTISQALTANTTYWIAVGVNYTGTTDVAAGRTPIITQIQGDYPLFRKRGISAVNSGSLGMSWGHSIGSYAGSLPASVTYAANSASFPIALRTPMRRSA